MKKTVKLVEPKPELDKVKRVYRAALETIQRLDDIARQKKAYREVFMPEAIHLRSRLQDFCERLLLCSPLAYGRKAEQLLWRKVYYDVIQLMKHNRRQMKPSSSLESAFRTHLSSAVGYYHHLLITLQAEFHLRLAGIVDFYHVPQAQTHHEASQNRKNDHDTLVRDWATKACHRCLIYLGDIARYQQDYDGEKCRVLSQRYYYEALALCPDIGMPHNQLGTLAANRYYGTEAAYHYLRCIVCETSFDGAHGNLDHLLEKNRGRYSELTQHSPRDLPPGQQRSKDIRRFLIRFLHLLDVFLNDTGSCEAAAVQELCQRALADFNLCMLYQPPHVADPAAGGAPYQQDRLHYLDDDLVFKLLVIGLCVIHQLQATGGRHVAAATAFSVAFFSHVLNHVAIRLGSALCELRDPRRALHAGSPDEKGTTTDDSGPTAMTKRDAAGKDEDEDERNDVVEDNLDRVDRRRQKTRFRRRRRRRYGSGSASESNDTGVSDDGDDSDLSEGGRGVGESGRGVRGASPGAGELRFTGGGRTESSGSDSDDDDDDDDDDDLMVSQEMRPGFSGQAVSLTPLDAIDEAGVGLGVALGAALGVDCPLTTTPDNTSRVAVKAAGDRPDITDYLKDLPADWLSDSASLLHFSGATQGQNGEPEPADSQLSAVMQGQKAVRVPPGFEQSEESQYVNEITQKITNFVIETDTDSCHIHTDTADFESETSTVTTESEMEAEKETDAESGTDTAEEKEQMRLEQLLLVITNEGLLASVKVFCDWMSCNKAIIATCAKSSQSLWSRLSILLNFLPLQKDLHHEDVCGRHGGMMELVGMAAALQWTLTQPLTEDLHLQSFPPLRASQRELDFSVNTRLDLSRRQEAIVRVCLLRRFGHAIASSNSEHFSYDDIRLLFFGPLQQQQQQQQQQNEQLAQERIADAEARRDRLMRDMAQLRLRAEVSQLEGLVSTAGGAGGEGGDGGAPLPPYVAPSAAALSCGLALLRQMAGSARFIVIIPHVVIDELDLMKKGSPGARDAIRWLEAEFRKGNRYVRAQRSHETMNVEVNKHLKKKDKEAWQLQQMTSCCLYLAQQGSASSGRGMAALLTGHAPDGTPPELSPTVRQAIAAARDSGLLVESVVDFHARWKEACKTNM